MADLVWVGKIAARSDLDVIISGARANIEAYCSAKDASYYSALNTNNYATYYSGYNRTYRGYDNYNGSRLDNRDSYNSKRGYYGGYVG